MEHLWSSVQSHPRLPGKSVRAESAQRVETGARRKTREEIGGEASDWLKRLAPVFQQMRRKTKPNRTMYA